MWGELQAFVNTYSQSLALSRAAFYRLLWGENEAVVMQGFRYSKALAYATCICCLKLLTAWIWMRNEYKATQGKPNPKIIEMLLNKLGEVAPLGWQQSPNLRSFAQICFQSF